MTIAAGFTCENGIILCADTEVSLSTFKVSGPKAYIQNKGDLRWGIVGAGLTDSVDMAIQKVWDALAGCDSIYEAKGAIEATIAIVYKNYLFPDPEGLAKRDFQLLIGLWHNGEMALLKTSRLIVVDVPRYDVVGSGWELASYLLDQLHTADMHTGRGLVLATNVLMQTKKYCQACGGESHIIRIHKKYGIAFMSTRQIEDQERFMKAFNAAVAPVLFAGPDLNVSSEEFGQVIAKAAETIETLRSNDFIKEQSRDIKQLNAANDQGEPSGEQAKSEDIERT